MGTGKRHVLYFRGRGGWVKSSSYYRRDALHASPSSLRPPKTHQHMPELFRNKYRTKSTRLQGWDYSRNGYYFVTICIKNKESYFCKFVDGLMVLTDIGKIVLDEWMKTEIMRSNVILDEKVIMPNHLHGIIGISNDDTVETHCMRLGRSLSSDEDACNASLPNIGNLFIPAGDEYKNKFGSQKNNLSSIIRGFKGSVKNKINKEFKINFDWQSKFYDHIIRNEQSLNKIRKYIIDNPYRWHLDRNNPEGLWM